MTVKLPINAKRLLLVAVTFALTLSAVGLGAQNRTITGTVRDSEGNPIIGASVTVPGTTVGITTSVDGSYSLQVTADAKELLFNYLGMDNVTEQIGNRTAIDVVMTESSNVLDEVVVVGYGVQKKRDLTGAVSSVSSKVLEAMPVSSAAQAITGRMAGVQVTTTEGGPNAEIQIRVRGGGSITQDNSPLYIIDGFPASSINDISPNDIQSIDILKEASSTAIYGARGANGVVIVTTKSGKAGKVTVSFNAYAGFKQIANELEVQDSYEYVLAQYEYANYRSTEVDNDSSFQKYYGVFNDLDIYKSKTSTNWQDEIFGRTAAIQNYNLSVNGGADKIRYNIGLTRMDDQSIMIGSGYVRNNINLKLNGDISKKLTFEVAARYSNTEILGAGSSTEGGSSVARLKHAVRYAPTRGLADMLADGDDYLEEMLSNNASAFLNPVDITNDEYKKDIKNQQTYNGALNWKIIKGLTFRTEWGVDVTDRSTDSFFGLSTSTARNNNLSPVARKYNYHSNRWRGANTLTYNFTLGQKNDFTILAGQEVNSLGSNSQTVESRYFPKYTSRETALANMDLGTAQPISTNVAADDNMLSYFGRVNYSYDSRYLLTASVRADGSSKFAAGHQWGYFPSVAAAWRINEEKFMEGTEGWLSNLKLRFSYGQSGNNRISSGLFRYSYYSTTPSKPYGINGEELTIMVPNSALPNEDLKWETTVTRNLGLDIGLWNGRVNVTLDLYKNTTRDLLIEASIPSSSGFGTQYQNIGRTSNRGVELTIDATLVNTKNFSLVVNANGALNRNRVDALGVADEIFYSSGWNSNITKDYRVKVGRPIGEMYGYTSDGYYSVDDFDYSFDSSTGKATWTLKDGVADVNSIYGAAAMPGGMKLKDLDNNNIIDENDMSVIGCSQPDLTGGFTIQTTFYGFDLSAYFNYVIGGSVYNANRLEFTSTYDTRKYGNMLSEMNDRFTYVDRTTGESLLNDYDRLKEANKDASLWSPFLITKAVFTDWAVEDGSFLRFANLTAGYTFPKEWTRKIGVESLRLYFTGTNLFCLTNYSGYDPEVDTRRSTPLTPNVDYSAFPRAKQYVFGVNITF